MTTSTVPFRPPSNPSVQDGTYQGAPPGFVLQTTEREYQVAAPAAVIWEWLEDPATFRDGQIWPYRVEFTPEHPGASAGFVEGGLNIHHGPLLSAAGRLRQIREADGEHYRELVYFYGSYVGSVRWVRPSRLEFWVRDEGEGTARVRMRFQSYVRTPWVGVWGWALERFWNRFGRWMRAAVARRVPRSRAA